MGTDGGEIVGFTGDHEDFLNADGTVNEQAILDAGMELDVVKEALADAQEEVDAFQEEAVADMQAAAEADAANGTDWGKYQTVTVDVDGTWEWEWDKTKLAENHMNSEIAQKAFQKEMDPEKVSAQQQWKNNVNPARHPERPEPGPSSYDGRGFAGSVDDYPDSYIHDEAEVPADESNVPVGYIIGFSLAFLIFWICAFVCYQDISKRNDRLRNRSGGSTSGNRRRLIKTPFSKLADELGIQHTSKSPQIETIAQNESYTYQDFVRECEDNVLWIIPVTVQLCCAYVLYYRTCRRTRTRTLKSRQTMLAP